MAFKNLAFKDLANLMLYIIAVLKEMVSWSMLVNVILAPFVVCMYRRVVPSSTRLDGEGQFSIFFIDIQVSENDKS